MKQFVLGVDLASSSWSKNGNALLGFDTGTRQWINAQTGVLNWPRKTISSDLMAETLNSFALERKVAAMSLDGPQGWRDPAASPTRKGVGRWCEFVCKTQGKTGCFGNTYPPNQVGWIAFTIRVFENLLSRPHIKLVNDPLQSRVNPPAAGQYYILECFPASVWRQSGLDPLPGHRKAPPDVVERFSGDLATAYGLPSQVMTRNHDDLQAVVGALPAAALLGGPCRAVAKGEPAQWVKTSSPPHWVEGLIWDAKP